MITSSGLTKGKGLAVAAVVAVSMTMAPAASATTTEVAAMTTVPSLPAPTGSHPVGTTSLHLTDTSRPDPWEPSARYRELMVSLFYPAASTHGPTKRFMTDTEAQAVLDEAGVTGVPAALLGGTRTNAVVDARPVGLPRSRPLIVLSPGFKRPRATLSSLAEDLASHGNVVAVVDHTYENVATTFPDGRVAPCGFYDEAFWHKLRTGRAADVSFVLDELTARQPRWRGARLVDPSRIAMGGHSVGGASTIVAMLADPRIKAGVDIDGATDFPVQSTLSRPFLFIGRTENYVPGKPGAETWEQVWPSLTGWRRWLAVDGMAHPSFTDIGLVGEQLGLEFGTTPASRGSAITRAYVGAFFAMQLRGTPQPLLEAPSASYPEVAFIR